MKKKAITQVLSVLVLVAMGISSGQAQVNISPRPPGGVPGSTTDQSALQAAIEVQQEMIRALLEQLAYLHAQLKMIRAEEPQAPRKEGWPNEAEYKAGIAEYQSRLMHWRMLQDAIISDIRRLQDRLQNEQQRLAELQSQQSQKTQQAQRTQEAQQGVADSYDGTGEQSSAAPQRTSGVSLPVSETPPVLARGLPQTEEDAEFAIGLRGLDVDFEFDPAADEELADFVLEREAELSYVQTRGTVARGSRTHSLTAGSGRSPREFRKKTEAIGLQGTVNHIEAVRFGAAPNPDLVATAIAQSLESRPEQDPMRAAFLVFRTSIQQANRDKAYFLSKLQRYNEIGNALSEHMRQLTDAMGSGLGCSDEDSGSRNVDTSILDPDHRTLADRMLVERAWIESDDGIRRTIRRLQQMEGQVRGRRQVVASQFENANQKSSQLYNMLSSVMKTMKEMEAGVIRNLR